MLPVGWQRRFERERRLAPLTTWGIGGPAEFYFEPEDVVELAQAIGELRRAGIAYRILGGGSNLLVSDAGVRGAVLSLARLERVYGRGNRIFAEAGAKLHSVVRFAASFGLTGAECLAGIPGRVGGAVFGNAGGKYGDIGSLVRRMTLLDPDGTVTEAAPEASFFRYRGSMVGDRIVLCVELALAPADCDAVEQRNDEVIRERLDNQPGWVGNAGCVFRNPDGGSAGRMIDEAGCKSLREGGVFVSAQHANFIENDGTGTADDVRRLVDRIRNRVASAHGVDLSMEVRLWE